MLSLILLCLADPLIVPTHVPEPTPADVKRAEAMAKQFGGAFPGGELNLAAAPDSVPALVSGALPPGTWARSYQTAMTGTVSVTACPGGFKYVHNQIDAAGVKHAITIRADCSRSGQTLYGVITHVEVSNLGVKCLALEGAPFAASVRLADGKLLIGRVRFDAADSGEDLSVILSGSYDPAPQSGEWPGAVRTLQSTAGWLGIPGGR